MSEAMNLQDALLRQVLKERLFHLCMNYLIILLS